MFVTFTFFVHIQKHLLLLMLITVCVSAEANHENQTGNNVWDEATEKLLLCEFKKLEESKISIKNKWQEIADIINKLSHKSVNAEQCRLKIKSLKAKHT